MELNNKLHNINCYPFHMPGHKRNKKFNIDGSDIDITEIDGFDNLHSPNDILLELEHNYKKLYNSKKSILSVNGSTCCILSAISAVCNQNDKIIIARNCHKSVYNACYLNKLRIEYILPEIDQKFNCFKSIAQSQIDLAIKNNPDAKAIVITSPTYEGIVSSINSPIPLIIDCAHGAHFGFNKNFPQYPNADIVISSLHKTLPALTQTAIINIYNDKYINEVKKYMDIYESSSPSYILMNSIDICSDFLNNCEKSFNELYDNCKELRKSIKSLNNFNVLNNDDISRFCIQCTKINGNNLADILRQEYKIEVEMSCNEYVILIVTVGDEKSGFKMLYNALKEINANVEDDTELFNNKVVNYSLPKKCFENYEIKNCEFSNLTDCENRISAEYVYAYPPGIPLIVPGEIIDNNIIKQVKVLVENGTNIISDNGIVKDKILTKC